MYSCQPVRAKKSPKRVHKRLKCLIIFYKLLKFGTHVNRHLTPDGGVNSKRISETFAAFILMFATVLSVRIKFALKDCCNYIEWLQFKPLALVSYSTDDDKSKCDRDFWKPYEIKVNVHIDYTMEHWCKFYQFYPFSSRFILLWLKTFVVRMKL